MAESSAGGCSGHTPGRSPIHLSLSAYHNSPVLAIPSPPFLPALFNYRKQVKLKSCLYEDVRAKTKEELRKKLYDLETAERMGMILDDRTTVAELLAQWYSNRKKVRDVKPEHCKRGMAVSILRWVSSDIRVWIRALSSVISIRHKRIFCGVYFVKVEKEPYQSRGKPFNGGHTWQTRSQVCSKP